MYEIIKCLFILAVVIYGALLVIMPEKMAEKASKKSGNAPLDLKAIRSTGISFCIIGIILLVLQFVL